MGTRDMGIHFIESVEFSKILRSFDVRATRESRPCWRVLNTQAMSGCAQELPGGQKLAPPQAGLCADSWDERRETWIRHRRSHVKITTDQMTISQGCLEAPIITGRKKLPLGPTGSSS